MPALSMAHSPLAAIANGQLETEQGPERVGTQGPVGVVLIRGMSPTPFRIMHFLRRRVND